MESTAIEEPYMPKESGPQAPGFDESITYSLLKGSVLVRIEQNPDQSFIYSITLRDLSLKMRDILISVEKKIQEERNDPTKADPLVKMQDYTQLVRTLFPALTREEENHIGSWLFITSNPARWIQVMLTDPGVSEIIIPEEGGIILVHHRKVSTVLPTILSIQKKDIDQFCSLFLKSHDSFKTITKPIQLKGPNKICLTISRHQLGDGSSCIKIAKAPSSVREDNREKHPAVRGKKQEIQTAFTIIEYNLLSDTIEVMLVQDVIYEISLKNLSEALTTILKTIKEDLTADNFTTEAHVTRPELHRKKYQDAIEKHAPGINRNQKNLLISWLLIDNDPVQWIRTILSDPAVLEIECPAPGIPIFVRHSRSSHCIPTTITPDLNGLERIAAYFLQSSGISHDTTEPVHIQFRTGETISITKITSKNGDYPRISIVKSASERENESATIAYSVSQTQSGRTDKKPVSSGTIQRSGFSTSDATLSEKNKKRIEEILAGIFLHTASIPSSTGEDISQSHNSLLSELPGKQVKKPFSIRFLNKNIRFTKGKSIKSEVPSEKKQDYYDDTPPPVQSILSVQQEEGVVAQEAYWLVQPYAYVAILLNKEKERTYLVVEPELTSRERIILEETHETLRDVLVYDKPVGKGDLVLLYSEVEKVVRSYDPKISDERLNVLYYFLKRNLNGYGKIDPLMHDELLEDISCNGHDLPVFVHHRLYGSMPTTILFDADELNKFVLKLSQKADKQVSLTSPLLDAALPNGSRAQITYSDIISTKGSSFTIRKFRTDPMTPATLLSFNTYNSELMAFLWLALENRKSLIVVGGTASGKTSAMNAFSFFIPHNSKIVSLEDTREIQIPHKNWLPVQTRQSSSMTDRGNIDLFDLLKASLRQRPEYIIVGEVRGSEAQTLFQAMNSGHTTLSTLHAGTIEEALNRLTNEPINVPPAMFGALDLIVVQTFHYRDGKMIRRCDAIHEILLNENGKLKWNTLYEYDPANDGFSRKFSYSHTLRAIQYMHNWTDSELLYQLTIRKTV